MDWNRRFAATTECLRRSTVREFLKYANRPGVISFGGGLPAAELFPVGEFEIACENVLRKFAGKALQYGETEGVSELREYVAGRAGVAVENVLMTSGAQQALDLLGRVLINAGDRIAVENPTYLALLSSWRVHRPEFQAIDSDENGLIACSLPGGVKAMYVVPNFQNPQGTTLSLERRHALAEFARREEMVVVEDDPYGDLRYEGDTLRSIFEIAGGCHGPVVKVGTFSKVLSPGLRLGWVVGHRAVIEKLVQAKQSSDLHTSTLSQYVALELVKSSFLDRHLPKLTTEYKLRRDAMIGALQQWMPRTVSWNRPQGGMFLLLRVEGGHLGREIAAAALKNNVLVIPGDDFHVRGGENTVRLNFSNCSPELIRMGVERLGKIIRELSEKRGEEANNRVSFSAT